MARVASLSLCKLSTTVVPGDAFGAGDTLRISYAAGMQTLRDAMDRMQEALNGENYEMPR